MSDINPNALSLEDAPSPTLESQPTNQPHVEEPEQVTTEADADAEPEGVVEVQGKRLVDVSVLSAERKRVREATAAAKEKEYEPLKQQAEEAQQLRAYLQQVQPHLEYLRQHPEVLQPPKPTPIEEQIGEEEAAQEARDLELYTREGHPDVARARRIIARRRQDAQAAAKAATDAAVGPIRSQNAEDLSRRNLERLALQRDDTGQPIVQRLADPKVLAQLWAQLPPELTAHEEVAELVMEAAIGRTVKRKGIVNRPERGPVLSEPSGGRSGPTWQPDAMATKMAEAAGMKQKEFVERAAGYKPGQVNILGD